MSKTVKQIAEDCGLDPQSLRPSTLEKILDGSYAGSTLYEDSLYEIIGALYRRIEKLEEELEVVKVKKRPFTNGGEVIDSQVKRIVELEQKLGGWFIERDALRSRLERAEKGMAEPIYKSGDNKDANGE